MAVANLLFHDRRELDDERHLDRSISQRFKKDNCFTGKHGEDVLKVLQSFEEACKNYNLTDDQLLRYFIIYLMRKQNSFNVIGSSLIVIPTGLQEQLIFHTKAISTGKIGSKNTTKAIQ